MTAQRGDPPTSEDRLILWLRRRLADRGLGHLGDDAAVLTARLGAGWAATVDQQIEGVHFLAGTPPAAVARRLLAVNLSDLAAMGAAPVYALLTVAAPPGFAFRRFYDAFLRACDKTGVALAGGDVARSPHVHTSLTLLGRKPARGRWVRRGNGRSGDRLWLGGTVGESALGRVLLAAGARLSGRRVELPAGLALPPSTAAAARRAVRRHLAPRPQLELGRWLGTRRRAAAIDVSDGLVLDLERLCRESGVGGVIRTDRVPRAPRHQELAERLGGDAELDPFGLALSGGEDYVLLFALPRRVEPPARFGCTAVGELCTGSGVTVTGGHTSGGGWDHLS